MVKRQGTCSKAVRRIPAPTAVYLLAKVYAGLQVVLLLITYLLSKSCYLAFLSKAKIW